MKPANENELLEITRDFEQFKKLENSLLKSAYLATSGRGFTEIKKKKDNAILLCRDSDNTFICYENFTLKICEEVLKTEVRFSTDITLFTKKEGE